MTPSHPFDRYQAAALAYSKAMDHLAPPAVVHALRQGFLAAQADYLARTRAA